MRQKGFTKIEAMVIIGIFLALIVGVGFLMKYVQRDSRGATRLSHMRQISAAIEFQHILTPGGAFLGCGSAYTPISACAGPGKISALQGFSDPSAPKNIPCQGASGTLSRSLCSYSASSSDGKSGAKTSDYQICFWLENNAASLKKGLHSIKTGGVFGRCD